MPAAKNSTSTASVTTSIAPRFTSTSKNSNRLSKYAPTNRNASGRDRAAISTLRPRTAPRVAFEIMTTAGINTKTTTVVTNMVVIARSPSRSREVRRGLPNRFEIAMLNTEATANASVNPPFKMIATW